MKRVLITGARTWVDSRAMVDAFHRVYASFDLGGRAITVVHGAAQGADLMAAAIVEEWRTAGERSWWFVESCPADWKAHGRRAGFLRNQTMVDSGIDLCMAFPMPGSTGTWDCVRRANAALIPVWVIPRSPEAAP